MTHVVAKGETLGTIAAKYLGSSSKWKEIWQANPQITNPDVIYIGQILNIPEVYGPSLPPGWVEPTVTPSTPSTPRVQPITPTSQGNKVMDFVAQNKVPLLLGAGALILVLVLTSQGGRSQAPSNAL